MDPNTIVLDISSDEEDNDVRKGIIDSGDDCNWITELFYDVDGNGENEFGDVSDDSDDVVVVSEVMAKKPRRRFVEGGNKGACLDDDDCVILDKDPDKSLVTRNDDPVEDDGDQGDDDDDDDDDLVVVSEKGQVACRDYPHSRHLCIKFPFSSTPNQSHCDQCYCYVCDSLAPCIYWGNGGSCLDHCQATDKEDFWKLERQNSRKPVLPTIPPTNFVTATHSLTNPVPATFPLRNLVPPTISLTNLVLATPPLTNPVTATLPLTNPVPATLPPTNLVPLTVQNQVPSTALVGSSSITPGYGVSGIINQHQPPYFSSRNKFQPNLVSQQLTRTSSCTFPRDRTNHDYNLAIPYHKPVFKRTVSDGFVAPTLGAHGSNMFMENYRNNNYSGSSQQPDFINSPVSFSQPNLAFEESLPKSNTQFDYSTNSQHTVNPNPFAKTPASQLQEKYSLPVYPISSAPSQQEGQSQRSTFDRNFFDDMNWPQSQTTDQPVAESSIHVDTGSVNKTIHANGSVGLVDYGYDNWMFNDQPCEPESIHDSGPFGLNEFSPEPAYIDTGTIFEF